MDWQSFMTALMPASKLKYRKMIPMPELGKRLWAKNLTGWISWGRPRHTYAPLLHLTKAHSLWQASHGQIPARRSKRGHLAFTQPVVMAKICLRCPSQVLMRSLYGDRPTSRKIKMQTSCKYSNQIYQSISWRKLKTLWLFKICFGSKKKTESWSSRKSGQSGRKSTTCWWASTRKIQAKSRDRYLRR